MAAIRKRDTAPEIAVRRALHRLGFRFRLHRADLPGTPDVVLVAQRIAIFVHGCFWHQHGCRLCSRRPKSRLDYWLPKLRRNAVRDRDAQAELKHQGWRVVIVWECQTKNISGLEGRLRRRLGRSQATNQGQR